MNALKGKYGANLNLFVKINSLSAKSLERQQAYTR